MLASPEPEGTTSIGPALHERDGRKRARPELLAELVFRPLAGLVVRVLLPLRVPPAAVVLGNSLAGLAGAVAIARGHLVMGALLLQLKTVLDNADGELARASGRASALGRYLDTEADLVVNAAIFAALARATGTPALAVVAFVALTLLLSANFNEGVLHRRARGEAVETEPSAASEGRIARVLARVYRVVFAPQDRAFQTVAERRLERAVAGVTVPGLRARAAAAYHDRFTAATLANLGLSTQLAVLGACLVLGVPTAYLWFVVGCFCVLPLLQLRRELLVRRLVSREIPAGR